MHRLRSRVGGGDDRPFGPTVHPPRSFRPIWPHLDPAACGSLLPASSQSPAAYFCGALCRKAPATLNDGEIAVASNEELHPAPPSPHPFLTLWNPLPPIQNRNKVGD